MGAIENTHYQHKHLLYRVIYCYPQGAMNVVSLLEKEGFTVVCCASQDELAGLVANESFDCVLLDLDVPDSSIALKTLSENNIDVITLCDDQEDVLAPIKQGAQKNLVKERIDKDILHRVIAAVVERRMLVSDIDKSALALAESEARFTDISERIEHGLWVRSADGKNLLYINKAFETIWGRTFEEINQILWVDTIHPDDIKSAHKRYLEYKDRTDDYALEYRIVRPDGSIRWVENKAYSILNESGEKIRMAGIVRDVTEQKDMEKELRLAQKLEGLGQLSAGIAHEINTPCQYVSDNISFLNDAIEDLSEAFLKVNTLFESVSGEPSENPQIVEIQKLFEKNDVDYLMEEIPQALNQSKNGMEQIKKIVLAMKGFSHPSENLVLADINEAISNTVTVARNEWKYVADLKCNFDENLPHVSCIPSAINQVVLNIIVNAAHAIADVVKEGELGKIIISTSTEQDHVLIKISDSGGGMPESVKAKIFDPFFTTKEVGKGTGQGLAIAHKVICEDHNGTIKVDSIQGKGTRFVITLPIKNSTEAVKEKAAGEAT